MDINNNSDNILLKKIIYELDIILEGCHNYIDIMKFSEIYTNRYKKYRVLIESYIRGKLITNKNDYTFKKNILNKILLAKSKKEAYKIINSYIDDDMDNDDILNITLDRIANMKYYDLINNNVIKITDEYCTKNCPHCGIKTKLPCDTEYVICGFTNDITGYDHKGCCKDWCFKCNKKLCKSWLDDELFNEENRRHDNYCCLNHTKKNNESYEDEYCQCNNNNVCRCKIYLDIFNLQT
jgi:hypothetical protein